MRHIVLAALVLAGCKKEAETPDRAKRAVVAPPGLRTGLYRVDTALTKFAMPGLPAQARQVFAPQTGREICVGETEVAQGFKGLARSLAEGDCRFEAFTLRGSALDARFACVTGSRMTAAVAIAGEVSPEAAKMSKTVEQSGGTIVTETAMTRIGDCAEKMGGNVGA